MKKEFNIMVLFCLITVFISACSNKADKVDEAFIKGLKENKLGNTGFCISIPNAYKVDESIGPDFNVYYFYPADTTAKVYFSGGVYFGNYPSEFNTENDSCKLEKVKAKILNIDNEWKVLNCNGEFSIQTIVENEKKVGWDEKIHAFGYAKLETEMNKLFYIFSTLIKK